MHKRRAGAEDIGRVVEREARSEAGGRGPERRLGVYAVLGGSDLNACRIFYVEAAEAELDPIPCKSGFFSIPRRARQRAFPCGRFERRFPTVAGTFFAFGGFGRTSV